MVGRIKFTHPKVVEYLLSEECPGFVATMRNRPRRVGEQLIVDVGGIRRFWGYVVSCVRATQENIEKYVEYSGFSTSKEWIEAAKKLHKGRVPRYIVFLGLIDDTSLNKG